MIVDARTPNGNHARFVCREDTSDAELVRVVVGADEYRLAGRHFAGWALDVGAHIGSVAVPLLIDNPDLRVVAVEPIFENRLSLSRNASLNGVDERLHIDSRAASYPYSDPVEVAYDYDEPHRYVGNLRGGEGASQSVTADAACLLDLCKAYGIAEVELLKIDCEGCEWGFLRDPAATRVREIVGEYHGDPAQLEPLLCTTHDLVVDPEHFFFRATRR